MATTCVVRGGSGHRDQGIGPSRTARGAPRAEPAFRSTEFEDRQYATTAAEERCAGKKLDFRAKWPIRARNARADSSAPGAGPAGGARARTELRVPEPWVGATDARRVASGRRPGFRETSVATSRATCSLLGDLQAAREKISRVDSRDGFRAGERGRGGQRRGIKVAKNFGTK